MIHRILRGNWLDELEIQALLPQLVKNCHSCQIVMTETHLVWEKRLNFIEWLRSKLLSQYFQHFHVMHPAAQAFVWSLQESLDCALFFQVFGGHFSSCQLLLRKKASLNFRATYELRTWCTATKLGTHDQCLSFSLYAEFEEKILRGSWRKAVEFSTALLASPSIRQRFYWQVRSASVCWPRSTSRHRLAQNPSRGVSAPHSWIRKWVSHHRTISKWFEEKPSR